MSVYTTVKSAWYEESFVQYAQPCSLRVKEDNENLIFRLDYEYLSYAFALNKYELESLPLRKATDIILLKISEAKYALGT